MRWWGRIRWPGYIPWSVDVTPPISTVASNSLSCMRSACVKKIRLPWQKVHRHCPSSYHHPYAPCMEYYLSTFGWFFRAHVCKYSMEHMGRPLGFFLQESQSSLFFRLPWITVLMNTWKHKVGMARVWKWGLHTKYIKIQNIPRFSI